MRLRVQRALSTLGLTRVRVALLRPVSRTEGGGWTVPLVVLPGGSFSEVEAAAERIAIALRVEEVRLHRTGPRIIELTTRPALPEHLPDYPYPVEPVGLVPARTPASVGIGVDADGRVVELPLFDEAGGTVVLVAGSPGSGKSSALRLIIAGTSPTATTVMWFDPKGGADAAPFAHRVEAIADAIIASVVLDRLNLLVELINTRSRALAAGWSPSLLRPVLVLVDEWASFGVDGSKQERAEVEAALRRIAATGRAARVSLVLATQRPTSTTIDVATRGLAATRLCFAVGDQHASVAALGLPGAELLHPARDRGTALIYDGAELRKVRCFRVPPNLIAATRAAAGLATPVAELLAFERAALGA